MHVMYGTQIDIESMPGQSNLVLADPSRMARVLGVITTERVSPAELASLLQILLHQQELGEAVTLSARAAAAAAPEAEPLDAFVARHPSFTIDQLYHWSRTKHFEPAFFMFRRGKFIRSRVFFELLACAPTDRRRVAKPRKNSRPAKKVRPAGAGLPATFQPLELAHEVR